MMNISSVIIGFALISLAISVFFFQRIVIPMLWFFALAFLLSIVGCARRDNTNWGAITYNVGKELNK